MTGRASPPGPCRSLAWRLSLLLSVLCVGEGCGGPPEPERLEEETGTSLVTLTIPAPMLSEGVPPGASLPRALASPRASEASALAYSYADVSSVRVDVRQARPDAPIHLDVALARTAEGWTGTLPALPRGRLLTFLARAHDARGKPLFSGSTARRLTRDGERVSIALAPVDDGASVTLPSVRSIHIPGAFAYGQSGNITFVVEAEPGARLDYALIAAPGGGSFHPSSGSLWLEATTGTFLGSYIPPPTVSAVTTFTHEVVVTNAAGHSLVTSFETTVQPPGSGEE